MKIIISTSNGMITAIRSDVGVLAIKTTTATMAVRIMPTPLVPSLMRQPEPRSRSQWTTMPDCEMLNEMNTPTE